MPARIGASYENRVLCIPNLSGDVRRVKKE